MADEQAESGFSSFLDRAYQASIDGLGAFGSSEELARTYLARNGGNPRKAANALIRWQNTKAATSGFISGLGGLITLPVALPANMSSLIYLQIRMITAIAAMGGHDIRDEKVKAACLSALSGVELEEFAKNIGISLARSTAIQNINTRILLDIKKYLVRHFVRAGSSRVLSAALKFVPIMGGVIGGTFDGITTNKIGNAAIRNFITRDAARHRDAGSPAVAAPRPQSPQ